MADLDPDSMIVKDATIEGKKDGKPIMVQEAIIQGTPEQIPQASVAPTTTQQQDITTAGQRKVNLIWEYTQAFIAIIVIIANMTAGVFYAFTGRMDNIPAVLSSSLFLIIGFYFSRTNHQAIGGTGFKANEQRDEYKGR